jgi:NAD(P)-dependent dehydrogenase (short-subunit alcohol dehydrogenase family)
MFAINISAPFLLWREILPHMASRGWGCIINIASLAGRTLSAQSSVCYSAIKAALIGFSRTLAAEAAPHRVTVNCIAPGPVRTPLTHESSAERQEKTSTRPL